MLFTHLLVRIINSTYLLELCEYLQNKKYTNYLSMGGFGDTTNKYIFTLYIVAVAAAVVIKHTNIVKL